VRYASIDGIVDTNIFSENFFSELEKTQEFEIKLQAKIEEKIYEFLRQ